MELADRWPLASGLDVRDALLAAYADPARGYHDTQHLTEVLDRLDDLGVTTVAVLLAAWFHDGVYDGAPDDEERSAAWAERALGDPAYGGEVARLVRLTATHDPAPDDDAGAALCDADLAVLAAPTERYDSYAAGVRRDHPHVCDTDFALGRAAVLRDLAGRAHLFHTAYGREWWDAAARANLARELQRLE
ncbi:MAG: HD domain-containing protein [Nocardioides sp.]